MPRVAQGAGMNSAIPCPDCYHLPHGPKCGLWINVEHRSPGGAIVGGYAGPCLCPVSPPEAELNGYGATDAVRGSASMKNCEAQTTWPPHRLGACHGEVQPDGMCAAHSGWMRDNDDPRYGQARLRVVS